MKFQVSIGLAVIGVLFSVGFASAQIPAYKSWLVNGQNLYTLGPNVGIGIAGPGAKLDVLGQYSDIAGMQALRLNTNFGFRFDAATGQKMILESANSGVWSPGITLERVNGNVGIGTTSPGSALDVLGVGTGIGGPNQGALIFRAQDGLGRSPIAAYGNIDGAPFAYDINSAVKIRQQSGTGWSLETTGSTGIGENLYVNGNAGIGTSAPQQRLEVSGGMRLNTNQPKPPCDLQSRGTLWFTQGSPDVIEICKTGPTVEETGVFIPSARGGLSCTGSGGNIYCFGGFQGTNLFNQIFEFDPQISAVTVKSATLPTARHSLSCAEHSASGKIYCFGGWGGSYLSQILEYNPATDSMSVKSATLPTGRDLLSCSESLLTNKIYCFGGYQGGGSSTNQILEYDPLTDSLVIKSATLPVAQRAHGCAEVLGKIYCFGGEAIAAGRFNKIMEYDPVADILVVRAETPGGLYGSPVGRSDLSCASVNGRAYCFGGSTDGVGGADSAEIVEYIPATNNADVVPEMLPSTRKYHSCAEAGGKIYCFGGAHYGALNSGATSMADMTKVVLFDPVKYKWARIS